MLKWNTCLHCTYEMCILIRLNRTNSSIPLRLSSHLSSSFLSLAPFQQSLVFHSDHVFKQFIRLNYFANYKKASVPIFVLDLSVWFCPISLHQLFFKFSYSRILVSCIVAVLSELPYPNHTYYYYKSTEIFVPLLSSMHSPLLLFYVAPLCRTCSHWCFHPDIQYSLHAKYLSLPVRCITPLFVLQVTSRLSSQGSSLVNISPTRC